MSSRGDKLIFGLGNPILSDDSLGIRVVERLRGEHRDNGVVFETGSIGGFRILDVINGFKEVVFVDSTPGENPGSFKKLGLEDLSHSWHLTSPHTINLYTAIELGKKLGMEMPEDIRIYVMEVNPNQEFGEELSDEVKKNIDSFVEFIKKEELGG